MHSLFRRKKFFPPITPRFLTVIMFGIALGGEILADESPSPEKTTPHGQVIVIQGKVSEKSAFNLLSQIVQNAGVKINNYPYEKYAVDLAVIRDVNPQDLEALKQTIEKSIATRKLAPKGGPFLISRAETVNNHIYVMGEHVNNYWRDLWDDIKINVEATQVPSKKNYSLDLNQQDRFIPSLVVGEADVKSCHKASNFINYRLTQDGLIFNKDFFTLNIMSISVEVR